MSSPTSTTSPPPASTQTSAIFVGMNPQPNHTPVQERLHAPSVEQSMQIQCFEDCLIRNGTMYGPARWPGIRVWDPVPDGIRWPNA